MTPVSRRSRLSRLVLGTALGIGCFQPTLAAAQVLPPPFVQSVAAAAAKDEVVAAWYRDTGYETLWAGPEDSARRAALFAALETAPDHGLPPARYDAAGLKAAFETAVTEGDRGRLELRMTEVYLRWAHDLTSGMLQPKTIDPTIVRDIAVEDSAALLARIAKGDAAEVLAALVPRSEPYLQLMKTKIGLESVIANGGWGPQVQAQALGPGDSGDAVVALRDRLVAMGYMGHSATAEYDKAMRGAVQAFQLAHGLPSDGVAGPATIVEINRSPQDRLKSVIVAMERERWMDLDRDVRHIWVNQPDFTARIVDGGRTVFRTRVVIGAP